MRGIRFIKKKRGILLLTLFIVGYLIPDGAHMPVDGATSSDYHPDSFWYYPWGKSVTHKGVDIFAKAGTVVESCTRGIVLYTGTLELGGKVVFVLGPKWRIHYYAHLDSIETSPLTLVGSSTSIGTVGSTGNARGKSPHLHYSVLSLMPRPWKIDGEKQGWKKMFFLDPIGQF